MAGTAGLGPTVESACPKEAYRSRQYAERAAREHIEYHGDGCRQCRRGFSIGAYHCTGGGQHWHIGHGRPKGERR